MPDPSVECRKHACHCLGEKHLRGYPNALEQTTMLGLGLPKQNAKFYNMQHSKVECRKQASDGLGEKHLLGYPNALEQNTIVGLGFSKQNAKIDPTSKSQNYQTHCRKWERFHNTESSQGCLPEGRMEAGISMCLLSSTRTRGPKAIA